MKQFHPFISEMPISKAYWSTRQYTIMSGVPFIFGKSAL